MSGSGGIHPRNDSSSSEDETDQFRSHVQIPNVNLLDIRKLVNSKGMPKPNLAKAGKRLAGGGKSVRFPDMYNPRDTMFSSNSSTNNYSDDEYIDEAFDDNLPSFQIQPNPIQHGNEIDRDEDEDDDDDSSIPDFTQISNHPRMTQYSSDEDDDDDSPSKSSNINEGIDITEQGRKSVLSTKSIEAEENTGGFKNILRKMSLVDGHFGGGDTSTSDTFIGRMLSISGGLNGLSGGGLAPGASRQTLDEEQQVGMEGEDGIEMKRLNFAELNDEARNLISSHVAHASHTHEKTTREGSSSDHQANISTEDPQSELITSENREDSSPGLHRSHESSSSSFYAPNPDLFLRREDQPEYDQQDFMLDEAEDGYVPPPRHVHAGVLSSLLKLYQNPQYSKSATSFGTSSRTPTLAEESTFDESIIGSSKGSTLDFSKLKHGIMNAPKNMSQTAQKMSKIIPGKSSKINRNSERFGQMIESSEDEKGLFNEKDSEGFQLPSFQNAKPKHPKKPPVSKNIKKLTNHRKQEQLRITVHVADILQRQRFIIRMCRALMLFGAPTHRLEEYLIMTSRVLEIDGQFIYFPGCMIISFGDATTRTSEVHMVRCVQGLNLSKLQDTHKIYKGVIHDLIGVEDAAQRIENLLKSKNLYPAWFCVFVYGMGSAAVCPFAFGGGWTDIPISFAVGCCVGYLQFYLASMSNLYSSVFEVTASIVVSFISRGIGSIKGGDIFCFSAIAQGSLALILPGYIILCGSLELQSRNLVAGSVRMFYAIIYSLFLGFGITLGAALYGWVDKNSVSVNTCAADHSLNDKWKILFVPLFALSLGLINQARWLQVPVMLIIASIGYIGNFFAGKHFSTVTEFTACIGAFIVGVLGNLYSRIWRGMAVSAMLPAIFVQVPSGIASKSSLISGVQAADQLTKGNGTTAVQNTDYASSLSFGATMVEVSIGISVGLFAAALVVYPFGKKKTGLFTL